MFRIRSLSLAVLLALVLVPALAAAPGASITPRAGVAFKDAGMPGVSTAAVEGQMASGPSHFYLRYGAGFVAPLHHHSARPLRDDRFGQPGPDRRRQGEPARAGIVLRAHRQEGARRPLRGQRGLRDADRRARPWDVVPEPAKK